MAERGVVIGARVVSGAVAVGVAVVTVLAVGLLPLPVVEREPRAVTVDPAPADQVRVCPGAAVRLGDASGAEAAAVFAIDGAESIVAPAGGEIEISRAVSADAAADANAAPEILRLPPADGALLAGAQGQSLDAPDFRGLTAAVCAEPSGSTWLVGGATTVGRTTLLLLSNPTEVAARVDLEIYGESGPVTAPGMTGIDVPPGEQRVFSLAGFAPGLEAPVVHVSARGGRVVANLQHSIVRGLDAVGVETIGAGTDPATTQVIPGVRLADTVGVNRASARAGWDDVTPAFRVAVPGDQDATVTVRVVPEGDEQGTSFVLSVPAGTVAQVGLDSGGSPGEDSLAEELGDGTYTVHVDSDVPVVAGVRASTAVDGGDTGDVPDVDLPAPASDLAWFAAAAALPDDLLFAVPDGPNPTVTIANPTAKDLVLELAPAEGGGVPVTVPVAAGRSASVSVASGAYLLTGAEGVRVSVGLVGPGELAAFVLAPPRPLAGAIVVRPD